MAKFTREIKDIVLALTYQCNGRCQFCNIWQSRKTFTLQPEDCQNLPRTIENVNLSGGEPFLRQDLSVIVKAIKSRCPSAKIIISTNGFLTQEIEKQTKEILKIDPNIGLAISLDGLKEAHEKLRGVKNSFGQVLKTIKTLKRLGVKNLKIGFTLGDDNFKELRKVYRLSKNLGLEFSLAIRHNSRHYFQKKDNEIICLKEISEEINWLISQELKSFSPKRWLRAYFSFGALKFIETGQRILPDYSGLNSLFIDPFGYIYPSNIWDLKLGKIQEIKNWPKFLAKSQKKVLDSKKKKPNSWVVCAARQAIKKHWLRVGWWILNRKINLYIK